VGDLKVADSEYEELATACRDYSDKMEQAFDDYISILTVVCQNAISDGDAFKNLQSFRETAQLLSGQFSSVAKAAATFYEGFVSEVDAADDYLY